MISRRRILTGLAALSLSACGRRGALEAPLGAQAPVAEAAPPSSAAPIAGPIKGRKKQVPITPPKTPFILDPIL